MVDCLFAYTSLGLACFFLQAYPTYLKLSLQSLSSHANPGEALRLALGTHILGKHRRAHRISLTFGHFVVKIGRNVDGLKNA
jgi:hypothetical protein